MKNPTLKEFNALLDKFKSVLEDVEKMKTSVGLLRLLTVLQICGTDRETFQSCVKSLENYEERLSGEALQDIRRQFDLLKHLLGKQVRSTEPLQRPLVDPDA